MKKSYIFMVVFLLIASVATYISYEKYFKPIQVELMENLALADRLKSKIRNLETTFNKIQPPVLIEALNEQKGPWLTSSRQHLTYFNSEEIEKAEMPEGVLPSFWYPEEYRRIQTELEQFAREQGVLLQTLDFGIMPPLYFSSSSPTRKQVLDEVDKFNTGIALAKYILAAKPKTLEQMSIWPERTVHTGRSGKIVVQTAGYKIRILNEDLLRFLDRVNQSDTYVNIDGIKIINQELRNPNALYEVDILISTAKMVKS
jgi:hypothetical protein